MKTEIREHFGVKRGVKYRKKWYGERREQRQRRDQGGKKRGPGRSGSDRGVVFRREIGLGVRNGARGN